MTGKFVSSQIITEPKGRPEKPAAGKGPVARAAPKPPPEGAGSSEEPKERPPQPDPPAQTPPEDAKPADETVQPPESPEGG